MTLDATKIRKLNRMNRAAQDAELGTLIGTMESDLALVSELNYFPHIVFSIARPVTGAEVTATEAVIYDGTDEGSAIGAYSVQVYRSDILLSDIKVVNSGFILTLKSNSTAFELTEGDIICAIVL
jgi:hypothetical protein